jgi:hypothetical protein
MNFSSAERFMSIPGCCFPLHIPALAILQAVLKLRAESLEAAE